MYLNLFLALVALGAAVHLICTANFMPTDSPISLVGEVSLGFGAAIGTIVTAVHGDRDRAMMFGAVLIGCLVLLNIEKAFRGPNFVFRVDQRRYPYNRRSGDIRPLESRSPLL